MSIALLVSSGNLLEKIDQNNKCIEDQKMTVSMIIKDNAGSQTQKKLMLFQKGDNKRLVFFVQPSNDNGIGFLSLPNNEMYMYLPAYSTIKKIASHVRNSSFAGTDFSYEDMEIVNYSDMYNYTIKSETDSTFELELLLKEGQISQYKSIIMEIGKSLYYPIKIGYYNKAGKHIKTLINSEITVINNYVYAKQAKMTNESSGSMSIMNISDVQINTGLSDDFFTTRTLERGL